MTAPHIHPDIPVTTRPPGDRPYREFTATRVNEPYQTIQENVHQPAQTRLIVLVPDGRIDEEGLVEVLGELAVPPIGEIRFIGLGRDEPGSRTALRLESLAWQAQELPVVVVGQQIVDAGSWLKAVQIVARPGDQIVCHTEQRAGRLGEELRETTPFPVHLIGGLRPTFLSRIKHGLGRLAFEVFPLIVVAGFFWLQINLDAQLDDGLLKTLVTILTVLAELGLVFFWSLFIQ